MPMDEQAERRAIETALGEIARIPQEVVRLPGQDAPCIYGSAVLPPTTWNETAFSATLNLTVPPGLRWFWRCASEVRVQTLESGNCLRGGVVLHAPPHVPAFHREIVSRAPPGWYAPGDLLIGERVGDSLWFVACCNPATADFGHVLLANPIDRREDWIVAGTTFPELLRRCLDGTI
jgi:hypothetical protein